MATQAAVLRLQTRPQFQAVLAGNTVARTAHFALHRLPLEAQNASALPHAAGSASEQEQTLFAVDGPWLGALVPKRWARRAVTRNAIRRQIYAVGQGFGPLWGQVAHVVRLRAGFDRKQFISATSVQLKTAVRQELEQLFERGARP